MPPKKNVKFFSIFHNKKTGLSHQQQNNKPKSTYTPPHVQSAKTLFFDREKERKKNEKKVEKKYFFGFREKKNHIEKKFLCKI